MKPKIHRTKTRKTKKTSAPPEPNADVAVAEEGALMVELSGAEAELGPCDYYGDDCNKNLMSINGDNGVLTFDDDIIDLLLDESDPGDLYITCGGDGELNNMRDSEGARGFSETSNQGNLDCLLQSCPSVESFLNCDHQVNDASTDEFIDWDCVWQEGSDNNIWHEKEGPDSMVSWLLDGDDEATIGKSNCQNFGEPLDHDDENALVAWLLS